ncbi:MAG: nitroreductase family protein [Treponema sp.]|jgi:nitroreductase|nr:nitroreductase family protein [Treponema sp.]
MNAIFKRRSVREFLPKAVEPEKIERILRAAFQAPSAHNRQPWEFLVVTGKDDLKAVAGMSPWAKLCAAAPALIACCANLKRGDPGYGDPNIKMTEEALWEQDLSAATQNALLQICDEGLGGVWLGWYPAKERVDSFKAYFKLPEHIVPVTLIALGYPAKEGQSKDRFDPARVHYEKW